ncbi:MAG: intracellular septation protein [Bradymonadia bacterium]
MRGSEPETPTSEPRTINPIVKQVLELGPTVAYFLIYLRIRDETFLLGGREYSGFIMTTLVFVPILLIAMAALWAMTRKLSRIQVFTAFMVLFFGGLTAWFNDERFFKMKTTLVYGMLSAVLAIGLLRGRSYLAYVMGDMLPMQDAGWMILTRRVAAGFAVLALANEVIWRTMSTDAWVKIETFGFPVLIVVFLWSQMAALEEYLDQDEEITD